MYNRYIPKDEFVPVEPPENNPGGGAFSGLLERLFSMFSSGGERIKNAGSTGILGKLGLEKLDKGDILLVLILIYLFRESEDDEWLIILALVLLMGL